MRRLAPILLFAAIGTGGAALYYYAFGSGRSATDVAADAEASRPPLPAAQRPVVFGRRVELPAIDGRDTFVRDHVQTLLNAHPGVATLLSVTCEGEQCRVVLDVPDMKTFTPAYERLQDTTFIGVAKSILLANPTPRGNKGAHRVTFTLEFASVER